MKKEVNEAYGYYKQQYGSGIILFHVDSYYEAYYDDAEIISSLVKNPIVLELGKLCRIEAEDNTAILGLIRKCEDQDIPVHIVSYMENGQHCLPKVNQILSDIEEDY